MSECAVCTVCDNPGTIQEAKDHAVIASNVREFHHETFAVWRCHQCDSLHAKDPIDHAHYYRNYFIQGLKLDSYLRQIYDNRIKQLKRAGFDENGTVLDFGCGSGVFVDYLKKAGIQSSGYDAYSDAWSGPEHLRSTYDLVTSYDVIEHVEDPRDFLATTKKLLRPGGLLLVGTPNGAAVSLKEPWLPEIHLPFHRHVLSERALCRMGESLGMEVALVENSHLVESLWPTRNSRFIWEYVRICGKGLVDVINDPPHIAKVLASPTLLFYAVFGYFFRRPGNMTVVFRVPN